MTKQRTGNAPGQGRQPTITQVGERAESLHVRVSPSQREKVARNGGGQWVRALIDAGRDDRGRHDSCRTAVGQE